MTYAQGMPPALVRVALLAVLALLAVPAAAPAAARPGTAAEERAIRAALRPQCATTARLSLVAVSARDPRQAILNFDAPELTKVCTAIVRRSSRTARRWRVVEVSRGFAATNRAIRPCPRSLPTDLRGTVQPRGGRDPVVYCGN
jgi:hypothetical protein